MADRVHVLTIGTFDTPHLGHASFLRQCEFLGLVTVGLNSDAFVKKYKGVKPVFNFRERKALIKRMGYEVYANTDSGATLIKKLRPEYLVIGSDWARKDYYAQIGITQDELDELDITLVYVPYTKGISTTELKRRLG